MKVHLRKRKQVKTGKVSLYLEVYKGTIKQANGKNKVKRDYIYLDMYLHEKPKDAQQREYNKQILRKAEAVKTQKEMEIINGEYGFTDDVKLKGNFIEYFKDQAETRLQSKGNYGNWDSSIKHLIGYAGQIITFKEIDEDFCEGFKSYLVEDAVTKSGKNLSSSSVSSYFNKFRACLRKAVRDKIIRENPSLDIKIPKVVEGKREYLTLDELKAADKAECRYDVLKRAFLFACLSGLRWSDVQKLTWSEVRQTDKGWSIDFHQKKTKDIQYHPIQEQAYRYMGERGEPKDRVFKGLKYSSYMNVELSKWMMKAGITKHITFHCSRHTYAVILLENGVDLFTVSKLLGHSDIKTTQIYAKIVDKMKDDAINKLPNIGL